ncbi:MAG: peptidase S58 family protein [Actinobacteria bacterium]|nr:MAG: peptidase S58 family protein [Actinomycetota bacterium]
MADPVPLPEGFAVGHWTRADGSTGCTVVIPPVGARGGVDVRGGGTATRETESLMPLANSEGPTAVLLTGGSAFGLVAADGVARWLAQRGLGRPTLAGIVPLVAGAVIFDLQAGGDRPGPDQGYEACKSAAGGVPERGPVGAGAGAAVGKALGRERATRAGVGYAARRVADGSTVAVLAVANSVGDVVAADGQVIGGPRGDSGELLRSAELIAGLSDLSTWPVQAGESTTLACVCTDASLDKRDCGIVARMAAAGLARAVDPVFSPMDGDVIFCIASGREQPRPPGPEKSLLLSALGTVAATATAAAIRDAVVSPAD